MGKTRFNIVLDEEYIKISITLKPEGRLCANADVLIHTTEFGMINLKGFQIWKSNQLNERLQEHINIAPPSHKIYGRYIPILFVEKESHWFFLEQKIYDAYSLAKSKQIYIDESIDPKSIPI